MAQLAQGTRSDLGTFQQMLLAQSGDVARTPLPLGEAVLHKDGTLDRARLREQVFADPAARARLGRDADLSLREEALDRGDIESLINYKSLAPGMPYAHPTVEHFTPLFVTLGASLDPEQAVETKIDGYFMGLAKRSFQVA